MQDRDALPADDLRHVPYARDRALFLDLDGTLLELASRPDEVRVDAALAGLLDALHERLGGALAVITGRHLDSIDALGVPMHLPAAGLHGLQWRDGQGRVAEALPDSAALTGAAEILRAFERANDGILLEDKGPGLALHYRNAPALESAVRDVAQRALERLDGAYHLQAGKMVLELKSSAANKGSAIDRFMQSEPFAGRQPVFIGDDVTDEDGFAVVNGRDGLSAKVGDGESAARWRLPDARAVVAWLQGYRSYLGAAES